MSALPPPAPGDPSVLLTAFAGDLARAGLTRWPHVPGNVPPLWLDPVDTVAPGDKRGTENDDRCVLSAFPQAGPPGGPYDRWRRMTIIDLRIRTLGQTGSQLAMGVENRIRRHLLGDTVAPKVDFDLLWTDTAGDHAFRVIQASLNVELQRIATAPGPAWHYKVEYLFELYSDRTFS